MGDDRTGRELTPRPTEDAGVVAPREPELPAASPVGDLRFSAGEQAHTVGLTEERAAQVVRQSSNARTIAFLAVLLFVLFIPLYWLYDIGLPVVGFGGRLESEEDAQYVTDVRRGYALYLANCARCHGNNGEGGIGPPLNDQAKLFNTITEQGLPGTGHLNPDYLHAVLREGGRYVCGDPNSVMPAWLEPKGPLNYREVEEIITFILATSDTKFVYVPLHVEGGGTLPPPVDVEGWRDPAWTPAPGATPVPACWRAPSGGGTTATPAPVTSPGTPESPRLIEIEGTDDLRWVDPATGEQVSALTIVEGETVEFRVINDTQIPHNLKIGTAPELAAAGNPNPLPGVEDFTSANSPQTFTHTFDTIPADQPQFACTVAGHYTTMNGNLVVQAAGAPVGSPAPGGTAAPGATPGPAVSPVGSPVATP